MVGSKNSRSRAQTVVATLIGAQVAIVNGRSTGDARQRVRGTGIDGAGLIRLHVIPILAP